MLFKKSSAQSTGGLYGPDPVGTHHRGDLYFKPVWWVAFFGILRRHLYW